MRSRLLGPRQRLRIDLHGVSVFGPGDRQTLIRWEWIDDISVDRGVVVRSSDDSITLPRGAFGLDPPELAEHLRHARAIEHRPAVIGHLSGAAPRG